MDSVETQDYNGTMVSTLTADSAMLSTNSCATNGSYMVRRRRSSARSGTSELEETVSYAQWTEDLKAAETVTDTFGGSRWVSRKETETSVVELITLNFFEQVQSREDANYIVILDRSASMRSSLMAQGKMSTRWAEAEAALEVIAPAVCNADPDGVTVYFFSDSHTKFSGCRSADDIKNIFQKFVPAGGTELHPVLLEAIKEHQETFAKENRPTRVLIIHDGEPSQPDTVKQILMDTANFVSSKDELFFSFVQCGEDNGATKFLDHLDNELDCKFDIVDTMRYQVLAQKGFSETIRELLEREEVTLEFLRHVKGGLHDRHCVVLIDRSASMLSDVWSETEDPLPTRWDQALETIKNILLAAANAGGRGVTLYFFGEDYDKYTDVTSIADTERYFKRYRPEGPTYLAPVLEAALESHFEGTKSEGKATAILVIHDGEPYSKDMVKQTLAIAANRIDTEKEVTVSFLQMGEDPDGLAFLTELDKGFGTRFDIVDTLSAPKVRGNGFLDTIKRRLQ
jgi:Mg-chelatase subunit ChlD